MLVMAGMVAEVRELQFRNVAISIRVTEFGIVTEAKEVPSKADTPILVTEFGMLIVAKRVHLKKADIPILLIEFGMLIVPKVLQS